MTQTMGRFFACFLILGVLAGCGGSLPPMDFKPLTYGYLLPLRLNVAAIDIDDGWTARPDIGDVSALSPVRPVDGLRQMAQDRLFAAGNAGRAVLHITDASILRLGDRLDGHLAVTLDIYTGSGTRTAFAEARVARSTADIPDGDEGLRQALYTLTHEMVDDMNVELEYQARRSLKDWLLASPEGPGSAVVAPVSQQPLDAGAPTSLGPLAVPAPASPPPLEVPAPASTPPPPIQGMSPPPGMLTLPGGLAPPVARPGMGDPEGPLEDSF